MVKEDKVRLVLSLLLTFPSTSFMVLGFIFWNNTLFNISTAFSCAVMALSMLYYDKADQLLSFVAVKVCGYKLDKSVSYFKVLGD